MASAAMAGAEFARGKSAGAAKRSWSTGLRVLTLGTSALALTAIASSPARAQDAPEEEQFADQIIVTAQGREQSLQDVPVAVSVVTGESLDDFGITSLMDAESRLPAVAISQAPSPQINIRGVGSGNNWVSSSRWAPL